MFKIITKLFTSDKRFLIGLILIACFSGQGYSQVKESADGEEVILPYTQEYLDQYNDALDKKAANYNAAFRSSSKAEAFNNAYKGNIVGACNLITCGSFEKSDVAGGTFRTAVGGTNGQYQADAKYTCWNDDGTVDWSEGQYISYSTTNSNAVYPGIIEPSTFDGGGFAIFSYQNEAIRQTLTVIPNTVYTVCFEIAVIPRYATVNSNNQGGAILEYDPNLDFGVRNGAVQITDPLTYNENDLVQHTTSDFPTRLSTSTSGNGGNQNPGGWTEINPYWENRCITFRSGNSATSVEVFYKTGNPGESVVLVDGLRLSVEGYANAPVLSLTEKTYCAPTQVQLNSFVTSQTPPGAVLKWTTNSDLTVTSAHLPNNPTVTTPGVWYAFYLNPTLGCTSPSRKLTLSNTNLDSNYTKQNVTCFGGNNGSIDLSVTGGSGTYSYVWTTVNGSGLNPSAQDQSGLTAGTYNVTVSDGTCTTLETVVITQPNPINVDAGNYGPLCDSAGPITLTGTPTNSNGIWSGTGVTNNGNGTASFNPAGLSGTIIVTYSYTNGSGCSNSDTASILVRTTPTVDDPADVTSCDSYTLPALTNGNYFTGSGGTGTPLFAGNSITTTQTIYVYAQTGTVPNCTAENSFLVTINTTPTVDDPADVTSCDSYTLPTLTNGNYFTGSGGTGTPLFAGNSITTTQTIYVYAQTGTVPNCTAENSFLVTINTTPTVDDPADVTSCDSYTLPVLTNGNYFTGSGGTGTPLFAGNSITTTQTIYVYAQTGTVPNCTAENSFLVTINTTPTVDDPADVTSCDSYTLPTLTNGNYFTGSGGTGTPLFAGNSITTTQTIYVYAQTGTVPNCTAENSFLVTINTTPTVDDPADVTSCDSYTLPVLTNGNYFTGSGGTGTPLFAGNSITTTQTIYVYAQTGTVPNCTAENSFLVTINTTPTVDDPADVTSCDSYTLPTLTNGNYFTGSGGTGTPLFAGNSITTTQTIYVYAQTGTVPNCTAENSFLVTINTTPTVDDPADVTSCDSYTLPALTNGNYFTGSGGTGTPLFAGNSITTTQTIYVYAQTGTVPNCTAENSFLVTINTTPTVDDPADVTSCDSYTLPTLTNGNYFTGSGGTGTPLFAGNSITTTQTIYVYAQTGTVPNCTAENSFLVTINTTPTVDDPADVTSCDSYTLPTLTNGNYFTGSGGTGTPLFAGNSITTTQTIYVYAQTGTVPNCTAENSFLVTINTTPTVDDPADVTSCDSYTLPVLTNGNYFTGSGGTGTPLFAGNSITTTQTIYVYAQTGTVPNCTAENSFLVTINNCSIILEKIASPNNPQSCTPVAPGEAIFYTFKVTNPAGNAPITNVELRDLLIDPTNNPLPGPDSGDTSNPGVLDAGETWIYTASYTVTQLDITNGQVQNTATVNGLAQTSGNPYPVSTFASVTVNLCQNAEISIVKSSTSATGDCISFDVDDTIDYKFVVSNDGDVDISNVFVNDTKLGGVIAGPSTGDTNNDGILNVGEVWTYNATYTVTQLDIDFGSVVNTATVSGNTALGTRNATSNTVTVMICRTPSIALIKVGSYDGTDQNGKCISAPGDVINYTFSVKNTGNVTLTNVMVTDAGVTMSGAPISLSPGQEDTTTFSATYSLTQPDIDAGMYYNQAVATGTPPNGPDVTDDSDNNSYTENDPTIVTICNFVCIDLIKIGSYNGNDPTGNCISAPGDLITYTFKILNTGNVTMTNVIVTDPLVVVVGGPILSMAPGTEDTTTFTATYAITQADIDAGQFTNQAKVTGTPPTGPNFSDISDDNSYAEDDPTITEICQSAAIAIVKESDQVPGNNGCVELEEDDVITYTFRITNEGNVSIDNVVVTDPLVGLSVISGPTGDIGSDSVLGINEIWEYTATYTVTQADVDAGEVINQATVNGLATNPSNTPVTDLSHPTSTTADGNTVIVICQSAAIALIKESTVVVDPTTGCSTVAVDDVITYTFKVKNTGNVTLTNVTVADLVADVTVIGGPIASLAPGAEDTTTFTATYTITQADIDAGTFSNSAEATGTPLNGADVTDISDDDSYVGSDPTVITICANASIALIKESTVVVDPTTGCSTVAVDDVITYTFKVKNTGNVTLTNVTVADLVADVTVIGGPIASLAPGAEDTTTFTATYTITQTDIDAGTFSNSAEATGTPLYGTDVTDTSDESSYTENDPTVITICSTPDIAIVKTGVFNDVDGNECADAGIDTITYTFTVTNQGNVSLSTITVTDPLLQAPNPVVDIVFQSGDTDGDGELDVTETWIYTATSYTITQDDIDTGSVTNQATATGTAPNQTTLEDLSGTEVGNDDQTVIALCQNADIAIVKMGVFNDVDGNECADADIDTITYTFTVTNEGNVSLSNIIVTDPLLQAPNPVVDIVFQSGDTDGDGELDVTETWIYTATSYTITQDDIDTGSVTNQATATGTAPNQTTVEDLSGTEVGNDDQTVIALCQNPDIAIVKTGVFNDVNGNECADAGIDTITYTFTVTNQGNVSLSTITVTDPLLQAPNPVVDIVFQSGDTDGDGELDVTETWIYTATSYTITQDDIDTGSVTNQATATGTAPNQTTVEDLSGTEVGNDDQTVIALCQNADIAIVKMGVFNDVDGNECADADIDTITYTFTVTNEGNVSLSNIIVTDPLLQAPNPVVDIVFQSGDTDGDGELDVTETWIYTATSYTITQDDIDTGSVTNQATATGVAPNQATVEDLSGTEVGNDDATIVELCQNADIAIVKTGVFNDVDGNQCADAGIDTITYTFTLTNEGNVSLSNITVTDPLLQAPNPVVEIVFQSGDTDGDGELDVTETWIYTATSYTITQDDIDTGSVTNQATATGTAPNQTTVEDLSGTEVGNDDQTVIELCQNPAIAIVKTGIFNDENGNDCSEVDETISYTFTVTNEGNVSLSNIIVNDPLLGGSLAGPDSGDIDGDGKLDVTETWIYTGTYIITQVDIDNGEVVNQATATGTAPDQSTVSDLSGSTTTTDDSTITVLCQNPAIAIVKTGIFNDENGNDCSNIDETISYTFTVTNEGNVSLNGVTVTDPLIANITGPTGDTDADGELDVTEIWTYTATYSITQDDIDAGFVKNQATATGTAPDATVVSDLSDESSVLENDPTVTVLCQNPAIAIVKTGIFNDENGNDCSDLDETISYTFTVTNEGNVSLSDVIVTDPLIATITGPTGDTDGDGELDVTETWTYTGTYAITQADIDAGQVINQATVKANDPMDNAVIDLSDESSVLENDPTIVVLCQNPAIAIVKTGIFNDENGNDCSNVDETISYTFTVTNEGNVSLSNISVTDPMIATITGPTGDTDGDGELDVTETWTYTGSYAITQVDIDAGQVTNQATAEGTAPNATVVSDLSDDNSVLENDPTIVVLCQNPVIALIKTGAVNDTNGNGCADIGETIDYSFKVFNLGNVTLSSITIADDLVNVVGGPITLAPGATDETSFTAIYTITQADIDAGEVVNQATANGIDPSGNSVSDLSDDNSELEDDPTITVLCQNPAIALIKVGMATDENGNGCADLGETIVYTFSVKNTGNVALTNITVTDPLVAVVGGPINLEAGAEDTTTFTATYTITQADVDAGFVQNQATADGIAPNGDMVTDMSDNNSYTENDPTIVTVCNILPPVASISLEKTGVFNDEDQNGASDPGETISYTFSVTNTGEVTLYNIVITDPLPGIQIFGGPIAQLLPGETDDTTFTATYTINDLDIGNGEVVNQATVTGEDENGTIVTDDSDDPTDLTNNDNNGDGDPDDPTVVPLPSVLDVTFEIYNGITPNGDNFNEYFQLVGIQNWPNNNVKIFNRWGVLVFETDGYGGSDGKQNVFRGISEGRVTVQEDKELPTGTYFYILTFPADNPGKASYTGYLYINR